MADLGWQGAALADFASVREAKPGEESPIPFFRRHSGGARVRVCVSWLVLLAYSLGLPAGGGAALPRLSTPSLADATPLEWTSSDSAPPAPPSHTTIVTHPIVKGETLVSILKRYGLGAREALRWQEGARPKANLNKLVSGRHLTLTLKNARLTSVQYRVAEEHQVVVEETDGGRIEARIELLPSRTRVVGVRGRIKGSFQASARRTGVPDAVISGMVDLLGWNIDFGRDVQPDDEFRVLYEQRTSLDGRPLRPGRIIAADYRGKRIKGAAFLVDGEAETPRYVDADGKILERTFLRYPLEFTRISSSFSESRFHPILKTNRAHLGVDFAAPAGTPVRAVATGYVRMAGWKADFGRHVEIDHGEELVSAYSHLRNIEPAVRPGRLVRQGEIIGYVGQSGLATGPHLHFAVFDRGQYVNPLTMKRMPSRLRLEPRQFESVRAELLDQLRAIPGSYVVAPSTPPVVLSTVAQARLFGPVVLTL